jgi:hypothetical protein
MKQGNKHSKVRTWFFKNKLYKKMYNLMGKHNAHMGSQIVTLKKMENYTK